MCAKISSDKKVGSFCIAKLYSFLPINGSVFAYNTFANLKSCLLTTVLQIRRGNSDNSGIISRISP